MPNEIYSPDPSASIRIIIIISHSSDRALSGSERKVANDDRINIFFLSPLSPLCFGIFGFVYARAGWHGERERHAFVCKVQVRRPSPHFSPLSLFPPCYIRADCWKLDNALSAPSLGRVDWLCVAQNLLSFSSEIWKVHYRNNWIMQNHTQERSTDFIVSHCDIAMLTTRERKHRSIDFMAMKNFLLSIVGGGRIRFAQWCMQIASNMYDLFLNCFQFSHISLVSVCFLYFKHLSIHNDISLGWFGRVVDVIRVGW